jgi:hypothetical protein
MMSACGAIFVGFCLFSLVGLLPGYALGWFFDTLQFRSRTFSFRSAISVPMSLSTGPIWSYFVGRSLSMNAVLVLYALLCICALLFGARALRSTLRARPRRSKQQLQVFTNPAIVSADLHACCKTCPDKLRHAKVTDEAVVLIC